MEAVILIGIQATGKSTFYRERFSDTHTYINLDTLKTRMREKVVLESCLRARQPFVIDNTNVLASERAPYIALAREAGFWVVGYYFQSSLADALRRNKQREGKAVIPTGGVVSKYKKMQPPRHEEGFDQLFSVILDVEHGFLVKLWINPPD
jgi:predicted kinase